MDFTSIISGLLSGAAPFSLGGGASAPIPPGAPASAAPGVPMNISPAAAQAPAPPVAGMLNGAGAAAARPNTQGLAQMGYGMLNPKPAVPQQQPIQMARPVGGGAMPAMQPILTPLPGQNMGQVTPGMLNSMAMRPGF